jgi:hypothetical protein
MPYLIPGGAVAVKMEGEPSIHWNIRYRPCIESLLHFSLNQRGEARLGLVFVHQPPRGGGHCDPIDPGRLNIARTVNDINERFLILYKIAQCPVVHRPCPRDPAATTAAAEAVQALVDLLLEHLHQVRRVRIILRVARGALSEIPERACSVEQFPRLVEEVFWFVALVIGGARPHLGAKPHHFRLDLIL